MMSRRLNRKSNRLRNFDYSEGGYYYVTICTKDKKQYFGEIINGKMNFNKCGRVARKRWLEIPIHYENVDIDLFIIMPNHIHGIIIIKEKSCDTVVGTEQCSVPTDENLKLSNKNYGLLSKAVKSFKNAVTKDIKNISKNNNFSRQRSFYGHIIRADEGLKWDLDENNPGE